MILPDMRTLVMSFVATDFIITLIMVVLWFQNRKRYAGTLLWVIDFAFQTTALVLISLRGIVPDLVSMVLSNTLVVTGNLLGLMALEKFSGVKGRHIHNYFIIIIFIFVHIWFSIINPDLHVRNLNLAIAFSLISIQFCWLIAKKLTGDIQRMTLNIGLIFVLYCLINLARIVNFFTQHQPGNDYFKPDAFETFVLITYQMLFIILSYNLALMFNRRLVSDVVTEEAKFSKAFHSSPYAIMLTRLEDGTIFEVNDGFVAISGYSYSEVIGKKTNDIHLWFREEERNIFVETLKKSGRVHELEFLFRKKTGEEVNGLISAEILSINDEKVIMSSINDITERKKSDELLKESQAILKAAMDCSPSGIAIADAPSGTLRYVNKAGLMIPAKTADEIVKDIDINKYVSSWNIKHPDGTPYKPEEVPLARAVLYGESTTREFIISRDENDDRTVLANAAPIVDESGKVKAGIVVFQDITDYKKAEEKLRQQYFTLKGLNDSSLSPIFSVDRNYCYTSFNKTHASVMKQIYNAEIAVGVSLLDCMSNEADSLTAKMNIDRALNGEQFTEEAFSGDNEMSRVYFEVSHNPVRNDNSEIIGVAVLAKDLTQRKKMEEELRETGEYLENLINYANAPIIVWDTNLRITRFNNAFENLTGLKAAEVINKNIDLLFPSESKEESMVNIRNTTLGKRWEVVEIPIINIDGTIRTVIWNSATIYDKDRTTPIASIAQGQDITERKRTERLLMEKISELEKFNKLMVGREIKMIELKQEINELCLRLKLPLRYKAAEENAIGH
jgi:PAS domain S-box-containing protein